MVGTDILTTQLQTGKTEMPSIQASVKDTGAVDVTLGERQQDTDNPVELLDDSFEGAVCNEAKCHQGTQTRLKTLPTATVMHWTLKVKEVPAEPV